MSVTFDSTGRQANWPVQARPDYPRVGFPTVGPLNVGLFDGGHAPVPYSLDGGSAAKVITLGVYRCDGGRAAVSQVE